MKIALLAASVAVLATISTGGYVWYLKKENAVLEANNASQALALDLMANDMALVQADNAMKAEQARTRMRQIARLQSINAKLNGELNEITKDDTELNACLRVTVSPAFTDGLLRYAGGTSGTTD